MPTISEFHGITIRMFHSDHAPPHFHATYGEFEATIGIAPVDVISGHLPTPARRLALEWGRLHRRDRPRSDDHERDPAYVTRSTRSETTSKGRTSRRTVTPSSASDRAASSTGSSSRLTRSSRRTGEAKRSEARPRAPCGS